MSNKKVGWPTFGPKHRNTGATGMGGGKPGQGPEKESKKLGKSLRGKDKVTRKANYRAGLAKRPPTKHKKAKI
tara:strand:+ start:259 stop:477 length:219 start_codon:yes stop_codon:yes gene_type:complete